MTNDPNNPGPKPDAPGTPDSNSSNAPHWAESFDTKTSAAPTTAPSTPAAPSSTGSGSGSMDDIFGGPARSSTPAAPHPTPSSSAPSNPAPSSHSVSSGTGSMDDIFGAPRGASSPAPSQTPPRHDDPFAGVVSPPRTAAAPDPQRSPWDTQPQAAPSSSSHVSSGPTYAPPPQSSSNSQFWTDSQSSVQSSIQGGLNQMASADTNTKKLIAGLLGIFLGSLGIHKFYLGMSRAGVIMLAATIGGWFLGIIGSFIIIGAVFFLIPLAVSILGLIEGILYLTKSDAEFEARYVRGKQEWL